MIHPRTVGLVAGFDLYESLRSRKALALILLYALIALIGCWGFSEAINRVFEEMNESLGAQAVDKLVDSDAMVDLVTRATGGDEALAKELLSVPPLALFYGWLITAFMPFIVALSSSDAISSELVSGSARFALFRVDRLSWAAGKLLGQTLLLIVGIAVGGAVAFGVGAVNLDRFVAGDTAFWLMRMSFRGMFYGFAYLGIALCASQIVSSNGAARGLALAFATFASVVGGVLGSPMMKEKGSVVIDAIHGFFPNAHDGTMFRPELAERLQGQVALLVIGLIWFAAGYWRLSRRDT